MLRIGVQTQNVIGDRDPAEGFARLRQAGFHCADFSLHAYLTNTKLWRLEINDFFNKTVQELERFFTPHKRAAAAADVEIHQMHMPYPLYVPGGGDRNCYLREVVAPKSLRIAAFLQCRYVVVHGFKLADRLGSEAAEWEQTENFLLTLAPLAKELGLVLCLENLYGSVGGHLVEGPCCHAGKMAARIDRLNERCKAEVCGFCFDTGHANLVGLDFERFITTLGQRLKVLHIHDNDGVADLHQLPFAFARTRENTCSTDWEGFVRGLRNIRFDGVLNFETAAVLNAFPEELHSSALALIQATGAYFARRIAP